MLRSGKFVLSPATTVFYSATMPRRDWDNTGLALETQRTDERREDDPSALLEAKDGYIAELIKRVALLSRELERKDAVLLRVAEELRELLFAAAPRTEGAPRVVPPEGVWGGDRARGAEDAREKSKRPALPEGYRLVATASDARVLVAPGGLRVAGYRGELDLRKAALDAREHSQGGWQGP